MRDCTWQAFTDEMVSFKGGRHALELRRVMAEFGTICGVFQVRRVTYETVRAYVQLLRDEGNSIATINKKLRYLRLAFLEAVRLKYAAVNPMDGWKWEKQPKHEIRVLTEAEEAKLLASAEKLYGEHMTAFVRFTLATWGRLSEVTGLAWDDVRFDDACVWFRQTKSKEDRFFPIAAGSGLLDSLRVLKAKTLQDGGPFRCFADKSNTHKKWRRVVKDAGIAPVTIHDLRRTGITRALLAGMPLVSVKELAGHESIKTTERYYLAVSKQDKRDAVARFIAAG